MSVVKVVATIEAKEEYRDEIFTLLTKLADETRKEVGVIAYDLHQNIKNASQFVFLEIWESKEALSAHENTAHFKAFVKAVEGKLNNLQVDLIKKFIKRRIIYVQRSYLWRIKAV